MLVNCTLSNDLNNFYTILHNLNYGCNYDFYLTGSRFFTPKTSRLNTDYDFFAKYTPEVKQFLSALGFTEISSKDYMGNPLKQDIHCIMRSNTKPHIDIQLSTNVTRRLAIQERLQMLPGFASLDKSIRAELWSAMYENPTNNGLVKSVANLLQTV